MQVDTRYLQLNSLLFVIQSLFCQQMEILSVHDLNSALHDFVNKDETKAFHSCLQQSIDEARVR
jgi:double-strand break repair protein MRE11